MFAKDIMTTNVITVGPDQTVAEIAKLLINRRISAAPVVDENGKILGIVSEGDLVHRVLGDNEVRRSWWLSFLGDPSDVPAEYAKLHGRKARDVMTKDVVTAPSFTPINSIAEMLEKKRIKRVPIVDNGKLMGIVSRANVIQALIGQTDKAPKEASPSDQAIRTSLLEEFNEHPWSSASTYNIVVKDGIVRYWGFVESEEAKEAMRIAAENIPGVKSVESNLGVAARMPEYI
ncbi:MAG: CBS domain-containing protein [Rhodospirillales bacterium]|nr:CBS domain-containing protein [Rhodospirillales bacterium]